MQIIQKVILHTRLDVQTLINFMNKERAVNISENLCMMRLIISHLVRDEAHRRIVYVLD